jgi:hypothetical protein
MIIDLEINLENFVGNNLKSGVLISGRAKK